MRTMLAVVCLAAVSSFTVAQLPCAGDCNADETVTINEVISGLNIGLGLAELATCATWETPSSPRFPVAATRTLELWAASPSPVSLP